MLQAHNLPVKKRLLISYCKLIWPRHHTGSLNILLHDKNNISHQYHNLFFVRWKAHWDSFPSSFLSVSISDYFLELWAQSSAMQFVDYAFFIWQSWLQRSRSLISHSRLVIKTIAMSIISIGLAVQSHSKATETHTGQCLLNWHMAMTTVKHSALRVVLRQQLFVKSPLKATSNCLPFPPTYIPVPSLKASLCQ